MMLPMISAFNEIMVENRVEGLYKGRRQAADAEAWPALLDMIKDLQNEVAELKEQMRVIKDDY